MPPSDDARRRFLELVETRNGKRQPGRDAPAVPKRQDRVRPPKVGRTFRRKV